MYNIIEFKDCVVHFSLRDLFLIGNADTGSLIGLDDEGESFVNKIFTGTSKNEIEKLVSINDRMALLFQALEDEGYVKESSISNDIPVDYKIESVYLHVTNKCNLHCLGCYSKISNRNVSQELTQRQIEDILDQLNQIGVGTVAISGGEPFMRKDIVEILQYAKAKLKIPQLAILTNGLLLTNNIANKIKPYVDILSISIDGFSKEKPTFIRDPGIFDKICNAIMICKAIGIRVNVLATIHEKNIEYMSQYVDFSNSLGVELSFSLLTCPPENMAVKEFIPSNNKLRMLGKYITKLGDSIQFVDSPMNYSFSVRKSCEVCKHIISVSANGDVYPCHMFHVTELRLGSALERNISDLLNEETAKHIRSANVDSTIECRNCEYKYLCGGGCRAHAYYYTKDINGKDPNCPMMIEYFSQLADSLKGYVSNISKK